jgi:hypothetical protein
VRPIGPMNSDTNNLVSSVKNLGSNKVNWANDVKFLFIFNSLKNLGSNKVNWANEIWY